jgi:hypothetical protein
MGRHRSDPRTSGVRHNVAGAARRDEWIAAGLFEALKAEAMAAFDRIIGLDLSEVSVDGSLHKAPYGGEGTGPNLTDRVILTVSMSCRSRPPSAIWPHNLPRCIPRSATLVAEVPETRWARPGSRGRRGRGRMVGR